MERFFIIDGQNTWYDWRSILTAKDVTPPDPKTNLVALDGMSGTLDLTEALTGDVPFNDRTVTASFLTDHGNRTERERMLRRIISTIHGRRVKLVEPDDPDHYFLGRVKVKVAKSVLSHMEFSIEATCEPWRYTHEESVRREEITGSKDIVISNDGVKTLCPTVTVSGSVALTFEGGAVSLTAGTYVISDLKLRRGDNLIRATGSGVVTFTYREADL